MSLQQTAQVLPPYITSVRERAWQSVKCFVPTALHAFSYRFPRIEIRGYKIERAYGSHQFLKRRSLDHSCISGGF